MNSQLVVFWLQAVISILDFVDSKFLLLHENKGEDAIKNFFNDVYDLFVKVLSFSLIAI